jgi:hypothetical protein
MEIDNCYFWSDSMITLAWIRGDPHRWKTFVSNRVTQIQEIVDPERWYHIESSQNPADVISRGLNPDQLLSCQLWWEGPSFLMQSKQFWPNSKPDSLSEVPEAKERYLVALKVSLSFELDLFERYSSLLKLQRITAYILRFIKNCKLSATDRTGKPILTVAEIKSAMIVLIKIVQMQAFSQEIALLTKQKPLQTTSRLICLNPFIDSDGILRVGGRISHSKVSYNQKHQIILPNNHSFSTLLVRNEHNRLGHAGIQAVMASLRLDYWLLNCKSFVKKIIRKCVVCFRSKPSIITNKMGDLPEPRVLPSRPFTNVGLDYAGPLQIKLGKGRGRVKTTKAYICIFVCMAIKAVHIELVCDLTTDSFLNALKRFIARRGLCCNIYSDNATNFVGANKQLKEFYQFLTSDELQQEIHNYSSRNLIQWNFIPPRAPNFGGLWEAAVKSTKFHLIRILGSALLTYDEMNTCLSQIESILNSRPLTPLSTDPNDLQPLTPSHFLIGEPLTSFPQENLTNLRQNRLSRYQLVTQLVQHFWQRWNREYLSTLQQRTKWQQEHPQVMKRNAVVVIHEDNTPPFKWPLGLIVDVHPGKDGIVRVISVKIGDKVFKRPVTKVSLLPFENSQ